MIKNAPRSMPSPRRPRSTIACTAALLLLSSLSACLTATTPDLGRPPIGMSGDGIVLRGEVVYRAPRGDQQIEGAIVQVLIDGKVKAETSSGPDGRFGLTDLPNRPFQLRVTKGGSYEDFEETVDPSTFANGRGWVPISLEGHLTVLEGKVISTEGEPVAGATIRTYPETAEFSTQPDGSFEIRSQFEAVEYRVEVSKAGYKSKLSDKLIPQIGETNTAGVITLEAYELPKEGIDREDLDPGGGGPGQVVPGD